MLADLPLSHRVQKTPSFFRRPSVRIKHGNTPLPYVLHMKAFPVKNQWLSLSTCCNFVITEFQDYDIMPSWGNHNVCYCCQLQRRRRKDDYRGASGRLSPTPGPDVVD